MPDSNIKKELVFTLYVRNQCHLCEEMLLQLKEQLAGYEYQINCVDIDKDETLQKQYAGRIPVLVYDEVELFDYFLDKAILSELLRRAK